MSCKNNQSSSLWSELCAVSAIAGGIFGLYKYGKCRHYMNKRRAAREIQESLANGWSVNDKAKLSKTFVLKTKKNAFDVAFSFADEVRRVANKLNHHPELNIGWGKVTIELFTHDAGHVTEKDEKLARSIDNVFEQL